MLKSNYKIQNENVGSSEVPSWLSKEPKERLKIYKIDKTNIDKDKYDFEFSPFTRNEKKELEIEKVKYQRIILTMTTIKIRFLL